MHEQLRVNQSPDASVSVLYPQKSIWSHISPDAYDYVAAVQSLDLKTNAKTIHPIALESQPLNIHGKPLGEKAIQIVQFKPEQDVVDTLFWYRGYDGQPQLIAWEKIRGPLSIRNSLQVPHLIAENGIQLNLPGQYFIEDANTLAVGDVVRRCAREMGLKIKGPIKLLGGSYSTTPDSPELVFPRVVEVQHPGWEGAGPSSLGKDFSARRTLRSFPCGEVASDFLRSGALGATDLRHVLADLRFVAKSGSKLPIDADKVFSPSRWTSSCPEALKLSRSQIRTLPGNDPTLCAELKKSEVQLSEGEQSVKAMRYKAFNKNSQGEVIETFDFDAILRDKIDFLLNMPWFFEDGRLKIAINIGIRPAQTHRNSIAHPVYTDLSHLSIEGLFCGLERGVTSRDLRARAELLLSNSGFSSVATPRYFGSGTPSSGYDPGVFHIYAQEIDPSKTDLSKLPPGTFFVDSEDILAMAETGEVRSLDLVVATMLLRARLGMSLGPTKAIVEESREARLLEKILSNPSRALTKLSKSMPPVFELIQSTAEGRGYLSYLDNEAEVTMVDSRHPDEKGLFDGVLRITPLHSDETEAEPGLNYHDTLGHFIRRRVPVPVMLNEAGAVALDDNNQPKFWPYKAYRDAVLVDEADALWLSEVRLPQVVGIEEYDRRTGKLHLAGFFKKVGIVGIEAEQRAVRAMVLKGRLPRELAEHEDYNLYRSAIMSKFLGYYVRDGMMNCRLLYKAWKQKPEHARVIAPFIPKMDPSVATEWLSDRGGFELVLDYSHGRNPLKAFISDIRGEGTSRILAQLAALVDKFSPGGDSPNSERYQKGLRLANEMASAFHRLGELRSQVKDVEKSRENLEILKQVIELRKDYYKPVMAFCREFWPRGAREFPASIIHPFFSPKRLDRWMTKVERKNLAGTINSSLVEAPISY